jgi:hypothetical protein
VKSKPAKRNPVCFKHKTIGHYDGFSVTEEVFRPIYGTDRMVCLTTGEETTREELSKRGAGTWMKVSETT